MLENFDIKDNAELSRMVLDLSNTVSSLSGQVNKLSEQFATHQHGGADGSLQIYNEPIRLKPGVYLQGGMLSPGEGSTIEIKNGSITTSTSYHVIKGEGGLEDVLENIDLSNAVKGQILVLRIDPVSTITLQDNVGNLRLNSNFRMTSSTDVIVLFHDNRFWYEIARSFNSNRKTGFTFLGDEGELTIASGAVTAYSGYHTIDTEGNAATDDLDTINEPTNGVDDGAILVIRPESSARTIVAKDGTGNLRLAGDFTMDDSVDMLTLIWTGSTWNELSRSAN